MKETKTEKAIHKFFDDTPKTSPEVMRDWIKALESGQQELQRFISEQLARIEELEHDNERLEADKDELQRLFTKQLDRTEELQLLLTEQIELVAIGEEG